MAQLTLSAATLLVPEGNEWIYGAPSSDGRDRPESRRARIAGFNPAIDARARC